MVGHPGSKQPLSTSTTDRATESPSRPRSRWRRVLAWVAETATEPSGVARLLGAHRTAVRLGIVAVAAGALLLLPGPSALTIVVVAVLALAAIAGAEILAAPPEAPAA
jgi:hypothetical protein